MRWFLPLFIPATALAVPTTLRHQARLLDSSGSPIEGVVSLEVSLWRDATSTEEQDRLWLATYDTSAEGGFVSVTLGGAGTPPVDSDWFASDVWVATSANGNTLLRQPLVSVPAALQASHAATADAAQRATVAERVEIGSAQSGSCSEPGAIVFDTDAGGLRVCVAGTWTLASAPPVGGTVINREYHEIKGWRDLGVETIPFDNSAPTTSEGATIFNVNYTPVSDSSRVVVDGVVHITSSRGGADNHALALWIDNQLRSVSAEYQNASRTQPMAFHHEFDVGSTSAVNIRLRGAGNASARVYLNGHTSSVTYGGQVVSWLEITEYE